MSDNITLREFCRQHDLAPSTVHRVAGQMGISLSNGVDSVSVDRLLTYFGISPAPKTEEAGGAIAKGAITLRPTGGIDLPEVNPCPNVLGDYSRTTQVQEQAAQVQQLSTDRLQQFLSAYTQHRVLGAIAQIDAQVDAIQATAINAALGKLNGGGNAA